MSIEKIKGALHDVQSEGFDALPLLPWFWQTGVPAPDAWRSGIRQIATWFAQQGVTVRDAVVVLPQSSHLPLARQAWLSELGGWMPRFETVSSVIDRLPSSHDSNDEVVGTNDALVLDQTIDALLIAKRLMSTTVGRSWALQQPDHLQVAVERVMALAHDWIKVCLSMTPQARAAHVARTQQWRRQHAWVTERESSESAPLSELSDDMGAREQWLAAQALEFALQSWPNLAHRNQVLFDHRPAAWLLVTVGQSPVPGSEAALMCHVLNHAQQQGVPVCWMPAAWQAEGWAAVEAQKGPSLTQTHNFDHEARAAAAWVIHMVNERRLALGSEPVALITHDRALSRRIRALLMTQEAQGKLVIADESGWTLSTTRAAAAVTRLLSAAHPQANAWDVMDWLLHGWINHGWGDQAVLNLEQDWRERQVLKPWMQAENAESLVMPDLWHWAQQVLAPVQALVGGPHALSNALTVIAQALHSSGAWTALTHDEAGLAVIKALHLDMSSEGNVHSLLERAWRLTAATHALNLQGLTTWVQQSLARVNYEPSVPAQHADVVFTPLGKAALRSFSGVVMPGVDEGQLGVWAPAGHLLGVLEIGLGLPSPQVRTAAQWEAFALLAAHPGVRAVYRQNRDGEPCGPSAWLGRWWWQAHAQTCPHHWPLAEDPCETQSMPVHALAAPEPSLVPSDTEADALWPQRLSASAYQRLRDCPYRYFAMDILKLKAIDDVEDAMASQDYGTWLHAVLKRYHEQERALGTAQPPSEKEAVRDWLAIADETAEQMGLLQGGKQAFFGLYRSTLSDLAERYVRWHMAQVQDGWQWHGLEQSLSFDLPMTHAMPLQHIRLYGELDRMDVKGAQTGAKQWRVIDYKTGSLNVLKAQVKQALEDTQMAFYALLTQAKVAQADEHLEAMYLRLHHEAVDEVVHEQVEDSAAVLAEGIASDLSRIYQGHGMLAMGEGRLCDRCEARGLCRKDHWAQDTPSSHDAQVMP